MSALPERTAPPFEAEDRQVLEVLACFRRPILADDIAVELGLHSARSVEWNLRALERRGLAAVEAGSPRPRNWLITSDGEAAIEGPQ